MPLIRPATPDDAAAIQAVYAPYVRETVISFEEEVPTVEEMRCRIEATLVQAKLPWLVAVADASVPTVEPAGAILGYACASRYRERAAYRHTVEVTAYMAREARRRGVGRGLYGRLFAMLASGAYRQALACITVPNDESVGFHESMGFTAVGHFPRVGLKFGRWCDVGWWQRDLSDQAEWDTRRGMDEAV